MGVPLLIRDLEFAQALDRAEQRHHGLTDKWARVKSDVEAVHAEAKRLNRNPVTYKALHDRLMVMYGLRDGGPKYDYIKRRPLEELRPKEYKVEIPGRPLEAREEATLRQEVKEEEEGPGVLGLLSKNKRWATKDLLEAARMTPRVLEATLEDLRELGYEISNIGGEVWLEKKSLVRYKEFHQEWDGRRIVRFAYATDTHNCSKHQQLKHLNSFYDKLEEEGIDTVYHAGDISDGYYKERPEHIYELLSGCIGADQQAGYIIDNYPQRKGITTKFITGNHDATHVKNGGADIGYRIQSERPDMEYLGYGKAKVWLTPKCDLDLIHPNGGKAYALSYKLQKYIDALHGGSKPRLLALGHFHAFCHLFYRNIDAFMLPGFQGDSMFSNLNSLFWQVGGIIMEVEVREDGEVASVQSKFVPYYIPTQV